MSNRTYVPHVALILLVMAVLLLSSCAPAATSVATQAPEKTQEEMVATEEPVQVEVPASTEAKSELTPERLVPELSFIYSSAEHDPVRNEIGLMLTLEWEKLGLRINGQPMMYESLNEQLKTGEGYHVYTYQWGSRPERLDPDVFLRRLFYSSDTFTRYKNPEYDALVDAQSSEMDVDKRKELVWQAQELIAQELPGVALDYSWDVDIYNSDLWENIQVVPGEGIYNYWTMFMATPKTDQRYLAIASNEGSVNFNPFYETSGADTENMRLLFDMLTRVGTDGLPKPCAAESWNWVDNTTLEVKLREGMVFSDGVPVTANDVKYSYDVQKAEGSSLYKPFLTNITSVDVIDDYNLVFNLENPSASILMSTFAQIYIIPEHIWKDIPSPKADYNNNDNPVGSGPFKLAEFRLGEELKMDANKNYQFPVMNDGFYDAVYSNTDAIFQGLINQDIHLTTDSLLPIHSDQAKDIPYLTIVTTEAETFRLLGFNNDITPFNDPKFRDAIGYTIDFDTILNVLNGGFASKGGYGIIGPMYEFWHNPNILVRDYNPVKARELLAAAGYEWDDQGLMYMPAEK